MLASAARRAGVGYVDVYTSGIGHDACSPPAQAWINGISFAPDGIPLMAVPVGLESELQQMTPEEAAAFREEMGVQGYDREALVRAIMAAS